MFAARYGCAPASLQKRANSTVPKLFGSYCDGDAGTLVFTQKFVRVARFARGPMPSRQS